MPEFYILAGVKPVIAETAKEAVERYARANNITAGQIPTARGVRTFEVSVTPPTIEAAAID